VPKNFPLSRTLAQILTEFHWRWFSPSRKIQLFFPLLLLLFFFLGDAVSLVFVLGKFTLDLDRKNKQGTARGQVGVNVGFSYLKKIFFSGFLICWTRFGRKFFGQALVDFIHSHPHTQAPTHTLSDVRKREIWMDEQRGSEGYKAIIPALGTSHLANFSNGTELESLAFG